MNREEAKEILSGELAAYRKRPYIELLRLLKTQETKEVVGATGEKYQIEVQAVLDDEKDQNLRVIAAIDNLGLRAFAPLTEDFIVSKDGRFIGE